jgi:hypothetical protein
LPVLVGPNTARTQADSDDGECAMTKWSGRAEKNAIPP